MQWSWQQSTCSHIPVQRCIFDRKKSIKFPHLRTEWNFPIPTSKRSLFLLVSHTTHTCFITIECHQFHAHDDEGNGGHFHSVKIPTSNSTVLICQFGVLNREREKKKNKTKTRAFRFSLNRHRFGLFKTKKHWIVSFRCCCCCCCGCR